MPPLRAIVAAAGAGQRFASGEPGRPEGPKQLVSVAGRPALEWSVECLATVASEVVVATPVGQLEVFAERLTGRPGVRCVEGGSTRWRSVRQAFDSLACDADDLVAIHDAARPALSRADLTRVVAAGEEHGAAVLGRSLSDTLKRVSSGRIEATVDRRGLFRAETPQVFRWDLLSRAFALADEADGTPTDESSLVERLDGVSIHAVEALDPNPKLTVPGDLPLLEALLATRSAAAVGPR